MSWIAAIVMAGIAFAVVLPGLAKLLAIIPAVASIWAILWVKEIFDKADRRRRC